MTLLLHMVMKSLEQFIMSNTKKISWSSKHKFKDESSSWFYVSLRIEAWIWELKSRIDNYPLVTLQVFLMFNWSHHHHWPHECWHVDFHLLMNLTLCLLAKNVSFILNEIMIQCCVQIGQNIHHVFTCG
jgi:hypothetical protein